MNKSDNLFKMNSKITKESIKSIPYIIDVQEIIKDKFFFATVADFKLDTFLNSKDDKIIFYCAHRDLKYQGFFYDFGPYDLANTWKYCLNIKKFLKLVKEENRILIQLTSMYEEEHVNSAFCVGVFSILYLNYKPDTIYNILSENGKTEFTGYRDASNVPTFYSLQLKDCFFAIKKASDLKFIDFDHFNVKEYVYYESIQHGDLNWIIPNKILAFSGPHNKTETVNNYPRFAPDFYFDYFRKKNVTTIIRLNEKIYDEKIFINNGFDHIDLIFPDGTTPSLDILNKFLKICENAKGAIAVHCKAGLGRTGTLIACYLIKHYRFTAHEAIGWCRICRPGSVIANQQTYLVKNEAYLLFKGQVYEIDKNNEDLSGITSRKIENESKQKKELNSKVKKITCKLKMINLEIGQQNSSKELVDENDKDTQGDILNKLKWTRSKSKIAKFNQDKVQDQIKTSSPKNKKLKNIDLVNKVLECEEEQTKELFRLNDTNTKNSSLSIKKLIQHYNSRCNENEKDNFRKNTEFKLTNQYRTRSFTSLLNRSKVHANPIIKTNLINNALLNDKLIVKTTTNSLKTNNKANILNQNDKKQSPITRSKLSKSELKTS